tara:strand:- start:171 stop:584 length:414 start_codon:yes stop_codon:yes gene_type:complete
MRHRKSGRKLNRNSSHRKALMKNLAIAFIERELIKTTVPKAKELRSFIEPLVTMAKEDSVANRRRAFNKLRLNSAVNKLFTEIAIKSKDRSGGYLRIIKAGFRPGDKADMAYVEWVDRDIDGSSELAEPELKEGSVA